MALAAKDLLIRSRQGCATAPPFIETGYSECWHYLVKVKINRSNIPGVTVTQRE
jgi:hypothetical protein